MFGRTKSDRRITRTTLGGIVDAFRGGTVPDVGTDKPRRGKRSSAEPPEPPAPEDTAPSVLPISLVAEVANCMWYIKTKHFRHTWSDQESPESDPRVRRTIGRINRCVRALADAGVELVDPVGKRYPPGGESLMRPLQFTPTAGVAGDVVSETVRPILYLHGRIVQRGEVFVAVPAEAQAALALRTDQDAVED